MNPVTYAVTATARRTPAHWDLTLDNGEALTVPTLDDAVSRIRTHLDALHPGTDHRKVTVLLTVAPDMVQGAAPDALTAPDPAPFPVPDGVELTVRFLAARNRSTDFADATAEVLPWVDNLPRELRQQCLADLWIAVGEANNHFRYDDLGATVADWYRTTVTADTTPAPEPACPAPPHAGSPYVEVPAAEPDHPWMAPAPEPVGLPPRATPPPEPMPVPPTTPGSDWSQVAVPTGPGGPTGSWSAVPGPTVRSAGFLDDFPTRRTGQPHQVISPHRSGGRRSAAGHSGRHRL